MELYFVASIILLLTGANAEWEITQAPRDVATSTGSDVTLHCRIDDSAGSDIFVWSKDGNQIWRSNIEDGETSEENTIVDLVNKYDLHMTDITSDHAAEYDCTVINGNEKHIAEVIVFDEPTCGSTVSTADLNTTLTCTSAFWGNLAQPNISFLDESGMRIEGHIEVIQNPKSATLTYVLPVTWEDDQQEYTCVVEVEDPEFMHNNCTFQLDIKYPVNNITITSDDDVFEVDDVINCTANGNPEPEVMWKQIYPMTDKTVEGDRLPLKADMLGDNTWMCIAQNSMGGDDGWSLTYVNATISFKVVEGDTSGATPSSWSLGTFVTFLVLLYIGLEK